ncbi:MAG: acetate--CoA ligase family protein [Nitrospinota bacterium]
MNETKVIKKSIHSDTCLENFFSPRGVAVIGASPNPGNQGKLIVESLQAHGYEGKISTVHPKGLPLPGCISVSKINDLPENTDLAIAAISANQVLTLIEPLAEKGIQYLIVISGGFAETGDTGKALQQELIELGKTWGVRVLGPNCLGTFSAPDKFNSFFLSPDEIHLPENGPIAFISQSGAFLSSMLDQLALRGLGVRRAISFGNRIDVGECEALETFAEDPAVKVIGVYLESLQDGSRFMELARRVCKKKQIVILKGGKAEKGKRATQAHSASLAGSYSVFQNACKQVGIIEVNGLNELINSLHVFSLASIPSGNRVLIASNGGGMGVLLTDLCEQAGCNIQEVPDEIQRELKEDLPDYYSLINPIDLTGSGTNEQCALALDKLLKSQSYDCLLLVILSGTEGINSEIASQLVQVIPKGFPVIIGAYGKYMYPELCKALNKEGIPVFPSGEEAAHAITWLHQAGENQWAQDEAQIINKQFNPVPLLGWLGQLEDPPDEMQLKLKLAECGVPIPKRLSAAKREDLNKVINEIRFPMILKVINKYIKHKTEIKGIRQNLYGENDLLFEWKNMNKTWPGQIWAEEQYAPGFELMVGMHRDVDFGPVLLFGSGGKYVELFEDIERIILPARDDEILNAIFRTRAGKVIQGFRGENPLDAQKLLELIKLLAEWVENEPKIQSLDFNPIRLYPDSLVVLDAKITI